jgi:hypothetical protein
VPCLSAGENEEVQGQVTGESGASAGKGWAQMRLENLCLMGVGRACARQRKDPATTKGSRVG